MARFVIIGVIIAVAFILYALVDAAMSDPARARGVSKPVWVVMVVVLPVIGAVLWFTIGKGRGPAPTPARAPDDDPRFTGGRLSSAEIDAHVQELEARLRELDEETFPGLDDSSPADDVVKDAPSEPASDGSTSSESGSAIDPASDPTSDSAEPDNDSTGKQR